MSGAEFSEHVEHYRCQPWGDYRIDLAGASVASMLANINRDVKKRPQPFSPMDFMPFVERPSPAKQLRASLIHLVKKKVA